MRPSRRLLFIKLTMQALALFLTAGPLAKAGEPLEISRDFTLFTSKNLQGYLKPLFTSIEESFNTHMYTTAHYKDHWSIGIGLVGVSGMFIPGSHKTYDAELPGAYGNRDIVWTASINGSDTLKDFRSPYEQPTIYGGASHAVFAAPQSHTGEQFIDPVTGKPLPDTTFKSVAFVEGNNISFMSGVPTVLQLMGGFPTRTQVRIRFWGVPVQDEFTYYLGFMVNQQVDHFFQLFGEDSTLALAVNLGYHTLSRDAGLSMNSFSAGIHFSKEWDNGFTGYVGAMFETMSGEFEAVRENYNPNDVVNSPYPEVRRGDPVKFDIESFNSFRIGGGFAYRTGILELFADAAWAAQPILSFGINLWIAEWGEKEREQEKIEQFEEIERIERIKKKEKRD